MEIEQRLYNGDRAREVLENEQFIKAFEEIKAEIMQQWESSPARDAEGREKLWTMLALLKKVKSTMETSLTTGKLAKQELEHRQTMLERAKGILS